MAFERNGAWVTLTLTITLASIAGLPARGAAQLAQKLEDLEQALQTVYDGNPVSLEECIRVAEVGSVALGRIEEDVLTAQTGVRAAWMQWLPTLSANSQWQRQERTDLDTQIAIDPDTLEPVIGDLTITQTFESQSLSSSWMVFGGFDRFAERNEAKANLGSARSTLEYQRHVLREQVTNAFYDYIRAQRRVVVALDAEQLALRELERGETYFELGISTKSDVLQAKVRHQQTKLDVVRERNGERNAFLTLSHSMNIPGARPFEVQAELPEAASNELPELEALLDSARERRLDLVASEYQLDASHSGVTRARSGYYPAIEVFGGYSRSLSETPFRFGAQENNTLSWGLRGNWNIFDGWRTQQRVRTAVASQRRSEYDVRQKRLDIEREVVTLWNNLVEATESYEVSVVSVEQSQEDLRLAEERFRVGAGTALDLITAQVNLATARRDLVDAQINAIKFRSQLVRATGGELGL